MPLGFTVSDLHLFSKRSQADRYLQEIRNAAAQADLLVLNGDIFDFQWTTYPSEAQTLQAAKQWIVDLITQRPKCDFVFIIGNHDAVPSYLSVLSELDATYANIHWREHYLKIGDKLFTHGDALHGGSTLAGLQTYRASCNSKQYGRAQKQLYATLTNLGVASLANKTVGKRKACKGILDFLATNFPHAAQGLKDIYFGHTHNALTAYEYQNLRFHNCGGPFAASRFLIHEFTFSMEERDSELRRPLRTSRHKKVRQS